VLHSDKIKLWQLAFILFTTISMCFDYKRCQKFFPQKSTFKSAYKTGLRTVFCDFLLETK